MLDDPRLSLRIHLLPWFPLVTPHHSVCFFDRHQRASPQVSSLEKIIKNCQKLAANLRPTILDS
jgi:hypothetical protein